MIRVEVRATIRPTEVPEKVRMAVLKLFPDAKVEVRHDEVVAETDNVDRLRELIRSLQIPDSARGAMLADLSPDGTRAWFLLGKQAAAAGKPHFGVQRGPLGDLSVTITSDAPGEVERMIYRAAPDTTVPSEWAEIPRSMRPQTE